MITVHIRKQGGAAIMTIPSDVLKLLNLNVGATVELEITDQGFMVRPMRNATRKRYSLPQLLKGSKEIKLLNKKVKWAREGRPIGRELI